MGETRAVAARHRRPLRLRPGMGRAGYRAHLAQAAHRGRSGARPRRSRRRPHAGHLPARSPWPRNPFYELLHTPDPAGLSSAALFDIRPVTDNRPFFFYTVQPRDLR